MPPMEKVERFVSTYLSGGDSLDEARAHMRLTAANTTRWLRQELRALEVVLADPPSEQNALAHLVGWVGNWVLDDPSDQGAAAFLAELAEMLREVIAEAESTQH